jgi:hypothetical protein
LDKNKKMASTVVNVKVKYIRPKYSNLQEWIADSKNIYIGRRGIIILEKKRFPESNSIFCNPYKIGKDGTREDVLMKYENYIREKLANSSSFCDEFKKLKGKTLGCWCKPERCHGDILLQIINERTDV